MYYLPVPRVTDTVTIPFFDTLYYFIIITKYRVVTQTIRLIPLLIWSSNNEFSNSTNYIICRKYNTTKAKDFLLCHNNELYKNTSTNPF